MRKWFSLSAIGHDRAGIVAELAEFIYDADCNLEDSSMSRLGSEFAVLLLLSTTVSDADQHLASAAKKLEWEKQLTVFIRPLEGEPMRGKPYGVDTYEVQASGLDRAGIVARVARVLADNGASITHMSGELLRAVQSGTPVYRMSIEVDVPNQVGENDLRRQLDEVASSLHIEVHLKRQPRGGRR